MMFHYKILLLVGLSSTTFGMDFDIGGGKILKNIPCQVKHNQLKCSARGKSYPDKAISTYVDDNKALLRRMFGIIEKRNDQVKTVKKTTIRIVRTFGPEKIVSSSLLENRFPRSSRSFLRFRRDVEGTLEEMLDDEYFTNSSQRIKRQASLPNEEDRKLDKNKSDICESKTELETPFWAVNSDGKLRAILNNKEFEQSVHQEICTKTSTIRCNRDCSCEQKYKWHRLLAYDPNDDCAGIFMDWFLFPACCSCRCRDNPFIG